MSEYMSDREMFSDTVEAMWCREVLNRAQQIRLAEWAAGPLDPQEDVLDRQTREMVEDLTGSEDVGTMGRAAKALVDGA